MLFSKPFELLLLDFTFLSVLCFCSKSNSCSKSANCRAPILEVMIMIVFLKSILRPRPSVICPSSNACSKRLNTSGCAFSISSNNTIEYGFLLTFLSQLTTFFITNVSWRCSNQSRNREFLHVLRHINPNQCILQNQKILS